MGFCKVGGRLLGLLVKRLSHNMLRFMYILQLYIGIQFVHPVQRYRIFIILIKPPPKITNNNPKSLKNRPNINQHISNDHDECTPSVQFTNSTSKCISNVKMMHKQIITWIGVHYIMIIYFGFSNFLSYHIFSILLCFLYFVYLFALCYYWYHVWQILDTFFIIYGLL